MKCPLITTGWNATRGGDKTYKPDCLEEECAWWDGNGEQCALLAIVECIDEVNVTLRLILDNMPHAGQFTK